MKQHATQITIITIFVALVCLLIWFNGDKQKVKRYAVKETGAQVLKLEEDSCYCSSDRIIELLNEAKSTHLRDSFSDLHKAFNALNLQMEDRQHDHGGTKVKCYNITCKYDTGLEREIVVIVKPNGELISSDQELTDWVIASGEFGEIANRIYSSY